MSAEAPEHMTKWGCFHTEPAKKLGVHIKCIYMKLEKVGGAVAPPAFPVPLPLSTSYIFENNLSHQNYLF